MKKALMAMALVAGSAFAAPGISVVGFGAPAPVAAVRPVCPGPGYVWVDGYYGPSGIWVPGFWRAPVVAARIVEPHPYAFDRGREFHRDFRR